MMTWYLIRQKGRKNVGQTNLRCILEISARTLEVEGHRGKIDLLSPKNVSDLPQHFLHPHIRAHVPRAVVTRKQELEFLTRLPGLPCSEHPSGLGALDVCADP